MIKKLFLIAVLLCLTVCVSYAGGVTDNNNGNQGYIFVSTGENNGANSVGHWTDPSFLKGEKGDKGDTGAKGNNGQDGLNGVDGKDGAKGDNGQDGKTPVKNVDYSDGVDGTKGEQGERGYQGETGKGLKDRYEVIGEIRVLDTKKTTTSIYAGRDVNNNANIFGVKFTYKLGKSYLEKQIDAIEAKVNGMTSQPSIKETIVKDEKGNIISMSISDNYEGATVSHKF